MKARKLIKNEDGHYDIVWFGNEGIKEVRTANIDYDVPMASPTTVKFNLNNLFYKDEDRKIRVQYTQSPAGFTTEFWGNFIFNAFDPKINKYIEIKKYFRPQIGYGYVEINIYEIMKEYLHCISFSDFSLEIYYSYPVNPGKKIYVNYPQTIYKYSEDKDKNYSERQHGVADSLISRISVIKGELWYKQSYGLPVMDKIKSKGIIDSIIINYILDHPDVINIESFNSTFEPKTHTYEYECVINTIYNETVSFSGGI